MKRYLSNMTSVWLGNKSTNLHCQENWWETLLEIIPIMWNFEGNTVLKKKEKKKKRSPLWKIPASFVYVRRLKPHGSLQLLDVFLHRANTAFNSQTLKTQPVTAWGITAMTVNIYIYIHILYCKKGKVGKTTTFVSWPVKPLLVR